jgi:hypothetical protein
MSDMNRELDLNALARELQTLETEVFEIVDYTESSDLLSTSKLAATSTSCTSTCSGTTSTTSTCA